MGKRGIWRDPDEETEDYPGLWVHDGRKSGSITFDRSRLPIWCAPHYLTKDGWDYFLEGYPQLTEYGWDADRFADFLGYLFEARGEFARLLLVVADAERRETERQDADREKHDQVCDSPDGICEHSETWPPPWWDDADLKAPVVDQLRRCLEALDG